MTEPLIIIDPGHGAENFGTCQGDLIEKEITLALGIELAGTLTDWDVRLTRSTDVAMSFRERGAISTEATLALVIHVNASKRSTAHGLTCYFWPGNLVGKQISQAILDAAPQALRVWTNPIAAYNDPSTPDDDWIEGPRVVLGCHRPTAVLAEVGFSTNDRDRAYLLTKVGRSSAVTALRAGVCRALELG